AQEDTRTIRTHARDALVNAEAGARWLLGRVLGGAHRQADAAQAQTDALMRQALGLTPERTLARGYALVRDAQGQPVTRAAWVKPGQVLTLEFADGTAEVRAERTEPHGT
ncbi:MAG: exodeoxyribonuclease VII large subunit, partial [Deinococcota bacterium]